jgi:hypothetical protein
MKTEKQVRTFWVKALGNQRDVPVRFKPELGDIDLTVKGEDRWIYTIVQSVNPGTNSVSQMTKWLEVIPKEDHLAIVAELESLLKDLIGHAEAHLQFPHKDTSALTLAIIKARQALAEDEKN